jgi:hypothetical protein
MTETRKENREHLGAPEGNLDMPRKDHTSHHKKRKAERKQCEQLIRQRTSSAPPADGLIVSLLCRGEVDRGSWALS